jgi:hypothetical protein
MDMVPGALWTRIPLSPSFALAEWLPGARAISGGSFDDPNWFELRRHIWLRSAQEWVVLPPDAERFPEGSPAVNRPVS